jgi:hypothetical protein
MPTASQSVEAVVIALAMYVALVAYTPELTQSDLPPHPLCALYPTYCNHCRPSVGQRHSSTMIGYNPCPHCPQMKTILLVIIIPKLQVQILCNLPCQKALLISSLHKFFHKISTLLLIIATCPKQQWPSFGH